MLCKASGLYEKCWREHTGSSPRNNALHAYCSFNKKRKKQGTRSIQVVSVFLKGLPNFVFNLKQDTVAIGMTVFTDQSSGFCQVLLLLQHHWMVNGACWGGRVALMKHKERTALQEFLCVLQTIHQHCTVQFKNLIFNYQAATFSRNPWRNVGILSKLQPYHSLEIFWRAAEQRACLILKIRSGISFVWQPTVANGILN